MQLYDTKIGIGRLQVIFPQEKSQNRQTTESRNIQNAGSGEEARARDSIFQETLEAQHSNIINRILLQ